jgi:hypothetical protein
MTTTIKPAADPANPRHYLDKAKMHAALVDYKKQCDDATASGLEQPGISNYLGECFLLIARGIGHKFNFRNYSFLNDMISDGVLVCLKYVRSYDPARTNATTGLPTSPLSYFSQAIHFAYINRINLEAKQSRIKRAMIYSADVDSFSLQDDEDAGDYRMNLNEFISGLGKEEVDKMLSKKPKKADNETPSAFDDFV